MHYSSLAQLYSSLEATSKRLEKTYLISEFLKEVPKKELSKVVQLLQGRVFPPWDSRNLGFSSALAVKAIAHAAGESETSIKQRWKQLGDLGKVAAQAKGRQSMLLQEELTAEEVYTQLQKLASLEGKGSQDQKIKLVGHLLTRAKGEEARFLLRTVLEELRVGVADGTLRDAIAWAYLQPEFTYNPETNDLVIENRETYDKVIQKVQRAYDRANDFGIVAVAAADNTLESIHLELGKPLRVMLAQREADVASGMERVGLPAALEYKYDGFRMVIHKDKDTVTLFTRRLENVTTQFPDVVSAVKEGVAAETAILEGEAVGYNKVTKKYTAFQEISQRIRRKYDIEELQEKLPVELIVFDLLYIGTEELLETPFKERRQKLETIVKSIPLQITLSAYVETSDAVKGEKFYQDSLAAGNEGIMCKSLDGKYQPGSRVGHMVKVKSVLDTMDLVIVAAEWGEGKRSGWLTSFTLACQGDEDYVTIGRVGTGLKELEQEGGVTFKAITERLQPDILSETGRDVVVHPRIVVEVAFEEIQQSPSYSSGYALRFPRILQIREDRGVEDITSLEEVRQAFEHQRGR